MDAKHHTLALLAQRVETATICPSDVARALAAQAGDPTAWRTEMPTVHHTVDLMARESEIVLSWKGQPLAKRDGPYRIGRRAQKTA